MYCFAYRRMCLSGCRPWGFREPVAGRGFSLGISEGQLGYQGKKREPARAGISLTEVYWGAVQAPHAPSFLSESVEIETGSGARVQIGSAIRVDTIPSSLILQAWRVSVNI
jgi:hypothetical protein